MDYVPQEKKETVASKLEAEKQKLGELELRLRDLLATTASRRSSEDSGTITWSDEDSGKTADTVVRIIIIIINNIMIIMIIIIMIIIIMIIIIMFREVRDFLKTYYLNIIIKFIIICYLLKT